MGREEWSGSECESERRDEGKSREKKRGRVGWGKNPAVLCARHCSSSGWSVSKASRPHAHADSCLLLTDHRRTSWNACSRGRGTVAIIRDQSRAVPPWTAPGYSANVHGFGRDRLLDRRVLNIVLVVLVIGMFGMFGIFGQFGKVWKHEASIDSSESSD